ncbi:hypothetical protein MPLB_2040008 [Mesorhizobium sp. ORS 3324]|nr:hypothetical protein MPLB_2040008 [Mesorhizobium sp. ORS 3324]
MLRDFSDRLRDDANRTVQEVMWSDGIVNIVRVSEEIRLRNLQDNIAREDIEDLILQIAQIYSAPIEFDDQALTLLDLPDGCACHYHRRLS